MGMFAVVFMEASGVTLTRWMTADWPGCVGSYQSKLSVHFWVGSVAGRSQGKGTEEKEDSPSSSTPLSDSDQAWVSI